MSPNQVLLNADQPTKTVKFSLYVETLKVVKKLLLMLIGKLRNIPAEKEKDNKFAPNDIIQIIDYLIFLLFVFLLFWY